MASNMAVEELVLKEESVMRYCVLMVKMEEHICYFKFCYSVQGFTKLGKRLQFRLWIVIKF